MVLSNLEGAREHAQGAMYTVVLGFLAHADSAAREHAFRVEFDAQAPRSVYLYSDATSGYVNCLPPEGVVRGHGLYPNNRAAAARETPPAHTTTPPPPPPPTPPPPPPPPHPPPHHTPPPPHPPPRRAHPPFFFLADDSIG